MSYESKFYSPRKSLAFNDVLIQPTESSSIESRLHVDLTSSLSRNIQIATPIMASPMDRVVNLQVAVIMAQHGASSCFHRFQTIESQYQESLCFRELFPNAPLINAVSAQLEDEIEFRRIEVLAYVSNAFIIDTAMGTNTKVLKAIDKIKLRHPKIDIIAGNIVSSEGAKKLIDHGADAIRAGVGNGSACLTRLQTGCGRGQLTVLIETSELCKKYNVALISDGGLYSPGDLAKAIAAGADSVIMGSPLAGHTESPGEVYYKYSDHYFKANDPIYIPGVGTKTASSIEGLSQYKQYRGMASKELQDDWRGGVKAGTTHEGLQRYLRVKGPLSSTLVNFMGGLRSAMSYCDSNTIAEFHSKAKFEELSIGSQKESFDRVY